MSDEALIAHLLRRTGFGPRPGQVEALAADGYAGALEKVLQAPTLPLEAPTLPEDNGQDVLVGWWLGRLADPDAGLHEKMVWFWHGHLTSSLDKTDTVPMLRQYELLSDLALGNARTLLKEITVSAAMLDWLDGNGSDVAAPNENYGRELLELFALGRDLDGTPNYSETDVRAAAYALSGWVVDGDRDFRVGFHTEAGPTETVTLLGRSVKSVDDVIDTVVNHAAFGPYIATKMYAYFHGVPPEKAVRDELAGLFVSSGWEIQPLVEAILRHPTFVAHQRTRPRFPIEWAIAANSVLGRELNEQNTNDTRYFLDTLGQLPFYPPNVAGWPISRRWLAAGATMTKAAYAWDRSYDTEVVAVDDPVAWIVARSGIYDLSDETRAALTTAANAVEGKRERASLLHALALASPEFSLA